MVSLKGIFVKYQHYRKAIAFLGVLWGYKILNFKFSLVIPIVSLSSIFLLISSFFFDRIIRCVFLGRHFTYTLIQSVFVFAEIKYLLWLHCIRVLYLLFYHDLAFFCVLYALCTFEALCLSLALSFILNIFSSFKFFVAFLPLALVFFFL